MNLNFLIKKNHIFKRRKKKFFIYNYENEQFTSGIYTKNQTKFEFVYLRVFKKIFRKKYMKKKPTLMFTKFWLMVKPNFLLTMKSKNSRMGSGVGLYVRVCSIMKPNRPIILFKRYSNKFIKNVAKYLKLKLNLNTYLHYPQLILKKKILYTLYQINNYGQLKNICIRGNYLSKKFTHKKSKQTMVYLRSPKHFNIGKHKILSFKNFYKINTFFNYPLHYSLIKQGDNFFFSLLLNFFKFHILFKISSLKITTKFKIKW